MATSLITAEPLTVTIGSEVRGVQLADAGDTTLDAIYRLLLDRAVLVFRDQQLAPADHVRVAESFGPLTPLHPMYPHVEGFPIARIRTDAARPPENEVWHSDLSCTPHPPFVSVLRAAELPPIGGDTLWADLRAVHDALPAELAGQLVDRRAEHTLAHGFRFVEAFGQQDRADALARADRATTAAVHPVVVTHPASGRRIVYVNESFTTAIEGDDDGTLLAELVAMVRNPRFQVRVRWAPGTVVIWDNWATQHFACGDYFPEYEREVQRVTVAADRRSSAFGAPSGTASGTAPDMA